MRASIRQVAAQAGVSAKTVSNVLLGRDARTSEATRERVLEVARELNYVPVRTALQNRRVETRVLGLVLEQTTFEGDPGGKTFEGIRREADAAFYDVLILGARPYRRLGRDEIQFLDRRSDGFIFVNVNRESSPLPLLLEHQIPAVTCYETEVPVGVPWVAPDNFGAMSKALEYLVNRGHRRVAHFAGAERHSDARERRAGFGLAMQSAGLGRFSDLVVHGDWESGAANEAGVHEVLRLRPSAVICGNDVQALLLRDVALAKGMVLPRDLSIIGMDNGVEGAEAGLTSLATPFLEVGRAAVISLLGLMAGEAAETLCRRVPAELVERASVFALGPA